MSPIKKIETDQAPQAVGPYAQAIQVGPWLYTSGQIPLTPQGELVQGGIEEQTRQVLLNLKAVLEAAGATLNDVVKTTVFITDMRLFEPMNEVYAQFFKEHKPARSCVQVERLPKDVQVEIECVAYLDK